MFLVIVICFLYCLINTHPLSSIPYQSYNIFHTHTILHTQTYRYNRKVDFLHQVTYEVYNDFILIAHSNKKKKKKKRSESNSSGVDPSIETFIEYDEDMEFLLLDDVLPTDRSVGRRKINLRDVDEERRRKTLQGDLNGTNVNLDNTMATANNGNGTPDVTLLSLGGVMSVSREGNFLFVCSYNVQKDLLISLSLSPSLHRQHE